MLGEGHHATVYRALDPFLERQVALKLPRAGTVLTAPYPGPLPERGTPLARLHHPQIVSIYEAGRDGDHHYLAAAMIEGRSLAEQLCKRPLSFRQSAKLVAEVAQAGLRSWIRYHPQRCQTCQHPAGQS